MRFGVLGPLLVTTGDGQTATLTAPKQQTLLAALLVARGQPVSVPRLLTELWPEGAPATATAALQVYVSELRKLLGDRMRRSPAGYLLDVTGDEVDAYEFEALLSENGDGAGDGPGSEADLVAALALWRGPVLDGVVLGPDATAAALRWTELRQSARLRLARRALSAGRHDEIVADLAAWVAEQPTHEPLVGQLMLALYRSGRAAEAVRAYERVVELLRDELGAAPGEELTRLAAAIRRQDPTLAATRPGIPASPTRFVGRRAELDQAAELLGRTRLLTVVGPGGCGKTRLAYQLVREVADDYPGGVYVVELAGFRSAVEAGPGNSDGAGPSDTASPADPSPVDPSRAHRSLADAGPAEATSADAGPAEATSADAGTAGADPAEQVAALTARVAAAVGAREVPGRTVAACLADHLGPDRALLVLDNCEHVRTSVAAMVHDLLAERAGLRVLATSREPLGLAAEFVFRLGGLALPAEGSAGGERCDAVRLFADRVEAARGGRRWRPEEEPTVVELCRRLDGLPLAIELAAARLRTLSLPEVVARLDGRLDLLVGAGPAGRHQTMRGAIDWGHDLLDPAQRVLLRRLSVFAGGFDLAAAERVGADASGPPPRQAGEVLDLLAGLVEQSMVDRLEEPDGTSRYRLIETTREYAAERLRRDAPESEAPAAARRHAEVYTDLLAAPPPTDGPSHARWLARIGAEHDNIDLALERALSGGDTDLGLAIATPMWWYWWVTGQMLAGRTWLGRVLKATEGEVSPRRGRALRAAAALARNSGDLDSARQLGEQALTTFDRLDDRTGVIAALNNLSITAQGQQDYDASLAFGERGLGLAESIGDERAVAAATNNIAGTLRCLDRLDEAADLFARALDLFGRLGDRRGEAAALFNLATIDRRQGRPERARERYADALDRYTELDMEEGRLDALEGLAHLAALAGRRRAALLALLVCQRRRSQLGAPLFTPDERIDRADAERLARAGLSGDEIDDVVREADTRSLADIATLLSADVSSPRGAA